MEIRIVQQNIEAYKYRKSRFVKRLESVKEAYDKEKRPELKKEVQIAEEELKDLTEQDKETGESGYDKYVRKLMSRLLDEDPHILLLSEYDYTHHQETIIKQLDKEYTIVYPNGYYDVDKKWNFNAVCILAVKKGELLFRQEKRKELVINDLRYIAGTLTTLEKEGKIGEEIKIFFTHVPSAGFYEVEHRAELLFAAYCFFIENRDELAFLGGDFNSDENNKTSLLRIFKKLYDAAEDTDEEKKFTYKYYDKKGELYEVRYDYALTSKFLASKCNTIQIPTMYECKSDHNGLLTTITL